MEPGQTTPVLVKDLLALNGQTVTALMLLSLTKNDWTPEDCTKLCYAFANMNNAIIKLTERLAPDLTMVDAFADLHLRAEALRKQNPNARN